MAFSNNTRRQPYNYETPEQRAREQLRAQKTIAGVTTRANEQAQSVAALTALSKGVPPNVLPPGGIHPQKSAADVQTATDRINQWRATQAKTAPGQPVGTPAPATTNVNGVPFLNSPVAPPAGRSISGSVTPAVPKPGDTRQTPTGGTETLTPSESGPRWVASVNNAPAPNNQNGQITGDPGGRTRQVQAVPIAPANGPAPTVGQNIAWAQNPTQAPAGKPWAPAEHDQVTTPQQASQIAKTYGDSTGGIVTYGTGANMTGHMVGSPYVPPAATPAPVPPPVPAPVASTSPVTSPSRAPFITPSSSVASTGTPNPDDEEERRRRMAATANAAPAPKPYQF